MLSLISFACGKLLLRREVDKRNPPFGDSAFFLIFAPIMEESIQYYDTYEENLQREILKMCTSLGMLDGELLASGDIDGKWKEWAPEYIAEALPEVNSYPEFAIACAGYAGMAVAEWWDKDWGRRDSAMYARLHAPRGYEVKV